MNVEKFYNQYKQGKLVLSNGRGGQEVIHYLTEYMKKKGEKINLRKIKRVAVEDLTELSNDN